MAEGEKEKKAQLRKWNVEPYSHSSEPILAAKKNRKQNRRIPLSNLHQFN